MVAGATGAAAASLEAYVAAVPDDAPARLALAWLRSTARDEGLRNAGEALRHARAGLRLQRGSRSEGHLVLALALASAGHFEAAGAELERARGLAKQQGNAQLQAELEALADQIARQRAVHSLPRPLKVASL